VVKISATGKISVKNFLKISVSVSKKWYLGSLIYTIAIIVANALECFKVYRKSDWSVPQKFQKFFSNVLKYSLVWSVYWNRMSQTVAVFKLAQYLLNSCRSYLPVFSALTFIKSKQKYRFENLKQKLKMCGWEFQTLIFESHKIVKKLNNFCWLY